VIETLVTQAGSFFKQACLLITKISSPLFASNELTLITQSVLIGLFAICAVRLGRGGLTAFMAVCWVLGNLFVLKEATIFNLEVITADPFAIGASLSVTLLSHYYGKKAAQNGILIGFFCAFFFMIMAAIQLTYIPNAHDFAHPHFAALLGKMTRIISSSFFVAFIAMQLNLYLFDKVKEKLGDQFFGISSFIALTTSQILDTTLFTFFALYGTVHSIASVILFSSIVKTIAIAISVPSVTLARKFVKKHSTL
jgi:uncharacterized integral membrane protein (TIGR00697 family)